MSRTSQFRPLQERLKQQWPDVVISSSGSAYVERLRVRWGTPIVFAELIDLGFGGWNLEGTTWRFRGDGEEHSWLVIDEASYVRARVPA